MGIEILKTDNICWEALDFTISLHSSIDHLIETLHKLVESWYTIGYYGGFGGKLHSISEIWVEEGEVGFTVDMGSAEPFALEIFIDSVVGFLEENEIMSPVKISLGNSYDI